LRLTRTNQRAILESLYARYHRAEYLSTDPLAFPRRYSDPADREVVALIAASFAFGNVVAINTALETILSPLGPRPANALRQHQPLHWLGHYDGFVYRWIRAADLRVFLARIGAALRAHQTLGALWASLDDPGEPDVMPALARWTEAIGDMPAGTLVGTPRQLHRRDGPPVPLPSGEQLLLTSPRGNSACKRMNMFLRWVCRPDDGIDLGLWDVSPARLVIPVDTHVLAAARLLGLTKRNAADLRTARDITATLAKIDSADPVRFDFALVRPGILGLKDEVRALLPEKGRP